MAAGGVLPSTLKSLQHYMKIAGEHDKRNAVVAYYARMYVAQQGIKIDSKTPEARNFLIGLMDALEKTKKEHAETNDAFKDDIVAQAVIEEYVLKLFDYADAEDRAERFGKNVIKAFYTAGMLMDVLSQFSEVSDEVSHKRKYAKWKAAHIHACLKNGEKPHAGPVGWEGEEEEEDDGAVGGAGGAVPNPGGVGFSAPPGVGFSAPPGVGFSAPPGAGAYNTNSYSTPQQPTGGYSNQSNYSWPDPNYPSSTSSAPPPPEARPYTAPSSGELAAASSTAAEAADATMGVGGLTLSSAEISQAQKYMKYASSALNFEDVPTAIENCEKALRLLKTGKE